MGRAPGAYSMNSSVSGQSTYRQKPKGQHPPIRIEQALPSHPLQHITCEELRNLSELVQSVRSDGGFVLGNEESSNGSTTQTSTGLPLTSSRDSNARSKINVPRHIPQGSTQQRIPFTEIALVQSQQLANLRDTDNEAWRSSP